MRADVRPASLGDHAALVDLFEELDEFHRQARPAAAFAGAVPRKVIELDNLVVRADQRGRKVGKYLLVAAMDWSRQQGATHVEVAVHAFNRDARRFYERFGFSASIDRLMLAA